MISMVSIALACLSQDAPPVAATGATPDELAQQETEQPPGIAEQPAGDSAPPVSYAERTAELLAADGNGASLIDLFYDTKSGAVLLGIDPNLGDVLHYQALVGGLGSNDVGLDRGRIGARRIVRFERVGPRVQLVAPNVDWIVVRDDPASVRAARDSFAAGVLASLPIEAERADGRLLLDASELVLSDAGGIAQSHADAEQGDFAFERERSAVLVDGLRAFADNVVIDARLAFSSADPGEQVRATAAVPGAPAFRYRQGFARLPDSSYRTRRADPRCGFFTAERTILDAPIDAPAIERSIVRHRLQPGDELVYYVDRAAPEPVRTALLEGARYWSSAFDAAGFPGAFKVELLPEDADPLDLRYNVIQWVYRSTRGWSYGDSIVDPRSGEIIKAHVTLGALRVRQDVRIAEGLLAPYVDGAASDERVRGMALARIKQLAAHEIGHTLGLQHNFAASLSGRQSVMDYPHPEVRLGDDGTPTLDDAYRDGLGDWDILAIRYGYSNASSDGGVAESEHLESILEDMAASGIEFLSDADANAGVHPSAHRWDAGSDPTVAFENALVVRRAALERFGAAVLTPGQALAELELTFVPLFLHHRYQAQALARFIGGYDYAHQVVGDGRALGLTRVAAEEQREALALLAAALDSRVVRVPAHIARLMPPPPPEGLSSRERISRNAFLPDTAAATRAAAAVVLDPLWNVDRLARAARQRADDSAVPSPAMVFDAVVERVFGARDASSDYGSVEDDVIERLMRIATDRTAASDVAGSALIALRDLEARLVDAAGQPATPRAAAQLDRIKRFLREPVTQREWRAETSIPAGPPIGLDPEFACSGCAPLRR